ncbi:MAG: sensor histidine kinase [Janthinobacterium lividum]
MDTTASFFPRSRKVIDKTDFLWLAYLVFFVIEPLERRSAVYWAENLAIMGVFLAMYIAFLFVKTTKAGLCLVAAMIVLGVVTLPFNGGATSFIIYAAALAPYAVISGPWVVAIVLGDALLVGFEEWHLRFSPVAIAINVFFTVVVGGTNFMFAQKQRADCKLRMKQEEIEALAAVAERERIARDLHDVLGHTLSVIVLKSELAGRLLERDLAAAEGGVATSLSRARVEIGDVERTARTALAEVREAIGGYRARGLGAEIEAARETLATAGVTLHTEGDLSHTPLTAAEETVLALALREAVTNIVRHAQATACRLTIVVQQGVHRLSIEDDGHHATAREGNGLRGMRERVESLGGQLSLTRERGTQLLIELPLHTT